MTITAGFTGTVLRSRPPGPVIPPRADGSMRIMLLCSTFNGLTQRVWTELRAAGHEVVLHLAGDDDTLRTTVAKIDPDLVICPFLRERVPADIWSARPTIVIHPGPKGDRGPSSLDWAIMDAEPTWGVTAVQAVQELDAGPIWASRTFPVDRDAPRKSALYNGPVTDAAVAVIHEIVARATDPGFVPQPLDYTQPDVRGRARPPARQADRSFSWSDPTEDVLRRIRAADGAPGVHTRLCGEPVAVFDAHRALITPALDAEPGTVAARRHGAVLVRTGDGALWIGHLRSRRDPQRPGPKLPATAVLADHIAEVPEAEGDGGYREIGYHREGPVGVLDFRFYNGAMSTAQCRRLLQALRHAVAQDTRVLLLRGGLPFANGIHLGVIDAAPDPAMAAWTNIVAIDDVCQEIITCADQLVVCGMAGSAGAGGVMLALGADQVLLRAAAVLNPHYRSMGLYGSEYWTYVLPRRVGARRAAALTTGCVPVGAPEAARIGLVDQVVPGAPDAFERRLERHARRLATAADYPLLLAGKRERRAIDEQRKSLRAYRREELVEMSADLLQDRRGFAAARHAFLTGPRVRVAAGATS
jgi:putative two-component system hydrogenase maturation factor HypX/HoxX